MGEIEVGRQALRAEGANIKTLAKAMLENASPAALESGPKVPARIEMTQELINGLNVLPHVFGRVQPEILRKLTDEELSQLYDERDAIKAISTVIAQREETVKQLIRIHAMRIAEEEGRVTPETELDSKGFPILAAKGKPQRIDIPHTSVAWSLEYRAGSPEIDADKLLDLYTEGEITKQQYFAMTRIKRVFDEEKAFKSMAKDPSLLEVFRRIIKKGRPSTSLFVRKQK